MVLSKVPSAVTAFACAACIAAAAALPGAGSAAERIANENAGLAAFTDVDAFSAIGLYRDILFGTPAQRAAAVAGLDSINGIPALLALLGGNVDTLFPTDADPGYAALSALDVFFGDGDGVTGGVFTGGGIPALVNYDALSAVPSYVALAQATSLDDAIDALGGIDAYSALPVFRDIANATSLTGNSDTSVASILGGYAALSAADTFFGNGPTGQGGVFTGAGIDALAPDADGNGGYAALSALPVFFGGNNGPFGPGVFNGGGVGALTNYAALSAIPAYLTPPPPAPLAASKVAPQALVQDPPTTTPLTGSDPAKTLVASLPKLPDFTPPAPPKEEPKISNPITTALSNVTPPSFNSGKQDVPEQAPVTPDTPSLPTGNEKSTLPTGKPSNGSYSGSFKPNPVLLYGTGGGNGGADNGIRGWDKVVNGIKGALGGGDSSSSSGGDSSSGGGG